MDAEREHKLVEQAKTNPQAFGELYDYYYPKLFNYTLRRLGETEAALDTTAVIFFKAWQAIPKFKWRGVPFSAWLYRIASNEVNSYFRQQGRKPLSLDALYEASGFEPLSLQDIEAELIEAQTTIERQQDYLLVQQLLQDLPMGYQEVLTLRYFEKKSLEDIATITGKKLNTVKSLLKRGVAKLKQAHEQRFTAPVSATFITPRRYSIRRKQL